MVKIIACSLLFVLLTFCAKKVTLQTTLNNGDVCRTPDDVQGACINIRQCPSIIKLLRQKPLSTETIEFLRKSQCGFDRGNPKVCCSNTATSTEEVTPPDVTGHANIHLLPQDNCGDYFPDRIPKDSGYLYEFPWLALISYSTRNGSRFLCGGSIINNRYILTAAHCISNINLLDDNVVLAGVRLGEHNIDTVEDCEEIGESKECAMPVQEISIERAIPHPEYAKGKHDIGLLRLVEPITFRDGIAPICLPLGNLRNVNIIGKNMKLAGWGITESGPSSSKLLVGNLPVSRNSECAAKYNPLINIGPQHICGGIQGSGICNGDTGGPLMLIEHIKNDIKMVQYGISSGVTTNCTVDSSFNIYTNVAFYMDWILDNIEAYFNF